MYREMFDVTEKTDERGFFHILVNQGEYKGTEFTLGQTWFDDDDKLSFECFVHEGKIDESNEQEFNALVGSFIMEILIEKVKERQEVENRTDNTL